MKSKKFEKGKYVVYGTYQIGPLFSYKMPCEYFILQ